LLLIRHCSVMRELATSEGVSLLSTMARDLITVIPPNYSKYIDITGGSCHIRRRVP